MYYVYMAKNDFGKLYVGITADVQKRLCHHNAEQGAQFTKGKAKFRIVFSEAHASMVQARKREIQIKKWRREKKEMLIEHYRQGLFTGCFLER